MTAEVYVFLVLCLAGAHLQTTDPEVINPDLLHSEVSASGRMASSFTESIQLTVPSEEGLPADKHLSAVIPVPTDGGALSSDANSPTIDSSAQSTDFISPSTESNTLSVKSTILPTEPKAPPTVATSTEGDYADYRLPVTSQAPVDVTDRITEDPKESHINESEPASRASLNQTEKRDAVQSSVANEPITTEIAPSTGGLDQVTNDTAYYRTEAATDSHFENDSVFVNTTTPNDFELSTDHSDVDNNTTDGGMYAVTGVPFNYTDEINNTSVEHFTDGVSYLWNVSTPVMVNTSDNGYGLTTIAGSYDDLYSTGVAGPEDLDLYESVTGSTDVTTSLPSPINATNGTTVILSDAGHDSVMSVDVTATAWLDYDTATSSSWLAGVEEDAEADAIPTTAKSVFVVKKAPPSTTKVGELEPKTEEVTQKPTEKPGKVEPYVSKRPLKAIDVTVMAMPTSTWTPALFVTLILKVAADDFRPKAKLLSADIAELMTRELDNVVITDKQVVVLVQGGRRRKNKTDQKTGQRPRRSVESCEVRIFLEDDKGYYSYELTKELMDLLAVRGVQAFRGTAWSELIIDMKFHGFKGHKDTSVEDSKTSWQPHVGILVAIIVSIIVVTIILAFIILQLVIMRRRRRVKKMRHSYDNRYSMDTLQALNMDNIQLTSIRMTENRWAYINPALVIDDKDTGSNPLNFTALSNFVKNETAMEEEFLMLPNYVARVSDVTPGAEDKNRYANVIPVPETRVRLNTTDSKNPAAGYINANYVRGYLCAPQSYIATQAPLKNTVEDFWRMVFEQKSQTILMLTALEENGSSRCVEYWPNTDDGDTRWRFGEFEITLLRREIRREWITSALRLKHVESPPNQYLDVYHFWLTSWTHSGLPEPKTLLGFLLDARPYMERSIGPPVVHCSTGTGRTGVVLAVDIQMLSFDDSKLVDILSCVCGLRQDRAGLVQNKEQYKLIYQTVYEYAHALHAVSRNPSRASSCTSSQTGH